MPVETRKLAGRLRTVEAKTGKPLLNSAGTPVDGGGWLDTKLNRGKAERQTMYINDALHKKHGGVSR